MGLNPVRNHSAVFIFSFFCNIEPICVAWNIEFRLGWCWEWDGRGMFMQPNKLSFRQMKSLKYTGLRLSYFYVVFITKDIICE